MATQVLSNWCGHTRWATRWAYRKIGYFSRRYDTIRYIDIFDISNHH